MDLFRRKRSTPREETSTAEDDEGALGEETSDVTAGDGPAATQEEPPLDQYFAAASDLTGGNTPAQPEDGSSEALGQELLDEQSGGLGLEDASEDGDDAADDLMAIFESEEVQDENLAVLTRDLEELDAESLFTQARDLSARLSSYGGRPA